MYEFHVYYVIYMKIWRFYECEVQLSGHCGVSLVQHCQFPGRKISKWGNEKKN